MDQPLRMHLADGHCERDGQAEKIRQFHRPSQHAVEWYAAGIGQHQRELAPAPEEMDRQHRPIGAELGPQRKFVLEALQRARRWAFPGGCKQEDW